MTSISFSHTSHASIIPFTSIDACASELIPFISKGKVALSGGSTFASLFAAWSSMNLNLAQGEFFPVDERIVPFDHPDSNWGNAYSKFLTHCNRALDKENFAQSSHQYSALLKSKFNEYPPRFNTILLGVGNDGHTASLFPNAPYLTDCESITLETTSPKPPFARISIGPALIKNAERVLTIIAGADKREIVTRILDNDSRLPIVSVLSLRKNSQIYIDKTLL